eukprot:TRINITY_DN11073_c0_g1_i1.p1 TRINITY_DN11073_c0_g1~~TRINITY_DN11073_c0_g1_i1.p1  ORF type:complete len:865 (+),score=153.71 TRINITY_DN11073_c0_g1_i1:112-2706(+)
MLPEYSSIDSEPPAPTLLPRSLVRLSTAPWRPLKRRETARGEYDDTSFALSPSTAHSRDMVRCGSGAMGTSSSSTGTVGFIWNMRHCTGNVLHWATLAGDLEMCKTLLDEEPTLLASRFWYHTYFKGQKQAGSGEAIHLAASRGHIEVVQLLLSRGARLNSMVTRSDKDHYDVLHAAVFAEGRNSNGAMVQALLDFKAPITPNSDGLWPLHMAFRVGNVDVIPSLRKEMRDRNVLEEAYESSDQPVPLLLGIQTGKMSEYQLAKAAAHTPMSLRIFIQHEPRCIPAFLRLLRERRRDDVTAAMLAKHLNGADLARVIKKCPEAATALLEGVTAEPRCETTGWHPLPSRVSYAPRNCLEEIRLLLNPSKSVLVNYEPDTKWRYDVSRFEAPAWHADLSHPDGASPIYDVDIRVCHVPNIICAEFFTALADASDTQKLEIFRNPVVSGSIEYVWWEGACRVDMLQVVLSLWGLAILVLESWHLQGETGDVAAAAGEDERKLRSGLSHSSGASVTDTLYPTPQYTDLRQIPVSAAFIGAKGVVDVCHEILQFLGCVAIHRPHDYLNFGNAWDLFRSAVLVMMLFQQGSTWVLVLVIFICWMRLVEVFTSAENVAVALLPIKRLARSLIPATVMTLVAFCAFSHAFYFVWGANRSWRDTFFKSFATLITTELPADPDHSGALELIITYGAVLLFSIFILNIFIGVIGTQYERETEMVPLTFLHHRAQCCLNFLLRTRVLPYKLCSRPVSWLLTGMAVIVALAVQIMGVTSGKLPWTNRIFVLCQLTMLLLAYQHPMAAWSPPPAKSEERYLWLTTPCANLGKADDVESADPAPEAPPLPPKVALMRQRCVTHELGQEELVRLGSSSVW